MDKLTRRVLLHALAGGALSTSGTAVLARSAPTQPPGIYGGRPADDVQTRAAALDGLDLSAVDDAYAQFRNGIGFRNLGFRNHSAFRNGALFRNIGGPFRNYARVGGWRNSVLRPR